MPHEAERGVGQVGGTGRQGGVLGRRVLMPPNYCFKGLCKLMTAKIIRRKQT